MTVFEREDRIGGLLMYGIPNMKLDKTVIERRRKLMEEEGVTFRTGVNVDSGIAAGILEDFDAVILACGAKRPRSLSVTITETAGDPTTATRHPRGQPNRDQPTRYPACILPWIISHRAPKEF